MHYYDNINNILVRYILPPLPNGERASKKNVYRAAASKTEKPFFLSFVPTWRQIENTTYKNRCQNNNAVIVRKKNTHASLLSAAGAGAPGGGCGGRASITVTCSVVFCWVSRGERRRTNFEKTVSGRRPIPAKHDVWSQNNSNNNNDNVANAIQVVGVWI